MAALCPSFFDMLLAREKPGIALGVQPGRLGRWPQRSDAQAQGCLGPRLDHQGEPLREPATRETGAQRLSCGQSSNILKLDPSSSLPTGDLIQLDGGNIKDCRQGKVIGDPYPEGGIDDFWVFDRKPQEGVCVKTEQVKGLNAFEEAKTR